MNTILEQVKERTQNTYHQDIASQVSNVDAVLSKFNLGKSVAVLDKLQTQANEPPVSAMPTQPIVTEGKRRGQTGMQPREYVDNEHVVSDDKYDEAMEQFINTRYQKLRSGESILKESTPAQYRTQTQEKTYKQNVNQDYVTVSKTQLNEMIESAINKKLVEIISIFTSKKLIKETLLEMSQKSKTTVKK